MRNQRADARRISEKSRPWVSVVTSVTAGAALAAILLVVYYVVPFADMGIGNIGLIATVAALLIVAVLGLQLRAVALSEFPQLRAIVALAVSVVVLLVAFAGTYIVMSADDPAAFSERLTHTSSLYFTITTVSTVGFGDISAKTDAARIVVMVQIFTSLAVFSLFLKLLLGTVKWRLSSDETRD